MIRNELDQVTVVDYKFHEGVDMSVFFCGTGVWTQDHVLVR
jgi:hypothetical protein